MLNKVILMGRLTKDPEVRQTTSGLSVCSFSVAVDRNFSGQNGERQTDFIDCTAWRGTADFIGRYFNKGRMIAVEGSLQNDNYTDNNGTKHYRNRVVVDQVYFCGDKANDNNGGGNFNSNNGGYGNNGGYNNGGNGGYNGNNSYNGNGGYNNGGNNGYNGNNSGYNNGGNNGYNGGNGFNGNNGGYNNNGFNGGNNGFNGGNNAPMNNNPPAPPAAPISSGSVGEFEEVLSDGEVPF